MKQFAKALVVAAAFAAAGAAQAEIANATLMAGGDPVKAFGYTMENLQGGGALNFSESLVGALNTANIITTAVGDSVFTEDPETGAMSVTAPVLSLSGEFDSTTANFSAQSVRTTGGALMTASALLPSGKKNGATTGGTLKLTDIKVDLVSKGIYATLEGGNGVGKKTNQLIWNYADIQGATVFKAVDGTTVAENTLSGLTITQQSFDLFAQSLGLTTTLGIPSMRSITDYGTMVARITVDVTTPGVTPTVPEPSTYALMGLGLVGLAFASKRARRA